MYAETDPNRDEIFIPKGTVVLAGQYEEGLPFKFQLKNDLRANSLKISFLSTIYASRNKLFDFDSKFSLVTSIYHKIIADNIDEVQQFNTNTASFSVLGSEQDFLTKFESNMDKANIGFMISSHVFKLSSSERKIKLILEFLPSSIFLFSDLIVDIVENTKLSELDIFNKTFFFDNSVAAKIGNEAFFEPDIFTCPLSLLNPKTSSFCIIKLWVRLLRSDPYIFHLYLHKSPLAFHFLLKK